MHVAVIGTGLSGVATACQLLQRLPAGSRLTLFNASGAMARGLAYGTQSDAHVLNVPAARMSLYPGAPGHFVAWARRHDATVAESDFVSRRLYGDYLQACLDEAVRSRPDIEVATHVTRVSRLEAKADGRHRVWASGVVLECQHVVLALGHFAPRTPHQALADLPAKVYANDPWSPQTLEGLAPDAAVALIGTGLTMLDVLLSLRQRGHRGQVLALSRRGMLPLGHRDNELPPPTWRISPSLISSTMPLRALLREFRGEVQRARKLGHDWRDVWGAFRSATPAAWGQLSEQERRQFLRHLQPYWDVHRHRAAPSAIDALNAAVDRGQLTVRAGRVLDASSTGIKLDLPWQPRGTSEVKVFAADRVINCSGPGSSITEKSSSLLWGLHQQGRLRRCPLGLGLEVDTQHRVLDAQGRPQAGLY